MIKKSLFFLGAICLLGGSLLKADQGMWMPQLIERLNYEDMKNKGLQLSAEEVYAINQSSLKDAVVQFGNGCTGEIVSAEGLLFTNHHCGYGQIQSHSTPENDYLTNGFWAKNKGEELYCPELSVKFLVRIEDVTTRVLDSVSSSLSESERAILIKRHSEEIEKQASEDSRYLTMVKPLFSGNEYYLFIYEEYKDVRLVGAPPSSIGKYGGDTDNWMWPRHTGDFAVFRVYMSPDGKPAAYNDSNVPYKPKHFLPIASQGIQAGDYAMIIGYPGSTQRYISSFGVRDVTEIQAPLTVKIRRNKLDIYSDFMSKDEKTRIQYASKYAGTSNYWKYFMGQEKQLRKNKVAEKKEVIEVDFKEWAKQRPQYANVLADLSSSYGALREVEKMKWVTNEAIWRGPEIFAYAKSFKPLVKALESKNEEKIAEEVGKLKSGVARYFKDYNVVLDQTVCNRMVELYAKELPISMQADDFSAWMLKNKNNYSKWTSDVYAKTIFDSKDKVTDFLAHPDLKKIKADPAYKWAHIIDENLSLKGKKEEEAKKTVAQRLFVQGVREMYADRKFAPDANLTMRISYGEVADYAPADAIRYDYQTTLEGLLNKEDEKNSDFTVPSRLKDLYKTKDFGAYAQNDTLFTCFLTTNDITGGNSGSPVLNAKGELIGLAFDGNWEAMSGDIFYEPNLQRTIVVDIRYVLFVIDKFAGATHLIKELNFTK